MNNCKWCNKKISSKRKNFCNSYCATNFVEISNIDVPTLWFKKLNILKLEDQVKEIIKFASFHKINPELVQKKVVNLREIEKEKV